MDRIFVFFGDLLTRMAAQDGSLGSAVFLFTACVVLFMMISIASEIRSLQIADHIRPLHELVLDALQDDPEEMGKTLIKLHRDFGYHTLLGVSGNLVHVVMVFLLAGTFLSPEAYLPMFGEGTRQFLWLRDMAVSPLSLILQGKFWPELVLAALGIFVMDYMVSFNVRFNIRRSLMPVEKMYKGLSAAFLLAAFLLPQVVTVYFLLYYFLKNIILIVFLRFIPYNLSPAQQVYYGEYTKKYKANKNSKRSKGGK